MEKRVNFSIIKKKYNALGKGNVRLTQSSLFLTQDISPTKSVYTFDVLENQTQTLQPDEIRLNINDEFVISHAGVYLYGEWNNGQAKKGFQLLTYAPIELGTDALLVKNLFAGQMKVGVNNIIFLEKWDLRKHEFITRTQFANQQPIIAGIDNSGFAATTPSNDLHNDGMIAFSPMLTLSGAKKNEISITLPAAISPATLGFVNSNGENIAINITRIAVRMYGLNAQNAAKFQGA
jgi:hypothetical protein